MKSDAIKNCVSVYSSEFTHPLLANSLEENTSNSNNDFLQVVWLQESDPFLHVKVR